MTEPRCTWNPNLGWLTAEHVRDCDDAGCGGCRPCGKNHCAMRGKCPNHVAHDAGIVTCPSCIGRTRTHLRKIEDRYAEVYDEALEAGVDSEAANLVGPAASPDQVKARRAAGVHVEDFAPARKDKPAIADDPHHPYLVLGRWDMALREDYDQPTDLLVTVSRAKDYLDGLLDVFAQDQPQAFEEFAAEVATCLTHLEDVLSDSRQPEKGAPCPKCKAETPDARKSPRLQKKYSDADKSGDSDTWHCPANKAHSWSAKDYRDYVEGDFIKHATALTADQAAERFEMKASVIRVWGSRELIRKRGKNQEGITLYDVADIEARHARDDDACA